VISGRHPGLTADSQSRVEVPSRRGGPAMARKRETVPAPIHSPPGPGQDTGVSARDPTDAKRSSGQKILAPTRKGRTAVKRYPGYFVSRGFGSCYRPWSWPVAGPRVRASQIAPAGLLPMPAVAAALKPLSCSSTCAGRWLVGRVIACCRPRATRLRPTRPAAGPGERLRHHGRLPQHNPGGHMVGHSYGGGHHKRAPVTRT